LPSSSSPPDPLLFSKNHIWGWVAHLPSKCEALSSNPSTAKKKKEIEVKLRVFKLVGSKRISTLKSSKIDSKKASLIKIFICPPLFYKACSKAILRHFCSINYCDNKTSYSKHYTKIFLTV
jgi:hypothetical protein